MEREAQPKKPKKKDSSLSIILFSSMGALLCLLVELYLMICMPALLPAIAVVGLAMLGCSYLALSNVVKRVAAREAGQEDATANILKSEKATYLLTRKYCDEIMEQLNLLEDKLGAPIQDVITAQKATAKVTISRNKENTDALMNSNDKLLDLVFQMDGKLDALAGSVGAEPVPTGGSDPESLHLLTRQLEQTSQLSGQLRELELSLKNEILQAVNQMAMMAPQTIMQTPQPQPMQAAPQPASRFAEPDIEDEPLAPMPDFEMDEPVLEPEPLADLADFAESDTEDMPVLDSEDEPLPDMEDEAETEPEVMEEEVLPEPVLELEPEPIAEPEPEPEPIAEELPPMPDLSDPNKMMSPDDIAALFANMGVDTQPEAEPEVMEGEAVVEEVLPEPEPEPEPEAEELPPMPDLSDPNKVMSPDEIAALFANLS